MRLKVRLDILKVVYREILKTYIIEQWREIHCHLNIYIFVEHNYECELNCSTENEANNSATDVDEMSYSSDEMSSCSSTGSDVPLGIAAKLQTWGLTHNITHTAFSGLLKLLQGHCSHLQFLPLDSRTLFANSTFMHIKTSWKR